MFRFVGPGWRPLRQFGLGAFSSFDQGSPALWASLWETSWHMQGHICRQVSESGQWLYFTIKNQKLAFKVLKVFSELWSLKHKERQGRCRLLLPSRETVEGARLDRHVLWKVHRLQLTRYWTKKDLLFIVKVCKGNLSTWPHHTWRILWDVRVRWQIKPEKSSFSFQFWKVRVKTTLLLFMVLWYESCS